jgi:glycosyltransferase involved in cell wall biosynthesis
VTINEEGFNSRIDPQIKQRLVSDSQFNGLWEFCLFTPDYDLRQDREVVFFTMWESTRLPQKWVEQINRSSLVLVPCNFNAVSFSASGVSAPIRVIPLGVNPDFFGLKPFPSKGPFIFGTGGRMSHGGVRKGIKDVGLAFQKAFQNESEEEVQLWIKVHPDCAISKQDLPDPKIKLIKLHYPVKELIGWYEQISCFVSGACAEGWGLWQQQALVCGRPLISIRYGGVEEFLSSSVGYIVEHRFEPASGIYQGMGNWSSPIEESLIEQLRYVYTHQEEAKQKGLEGHLRTKHLTWENTVNKLHQALREFGFVG